MLLGGLAAGYWARTHPSACPYALRFVLRFPRRALARERLLEILAPGPGERVLEIGPGTGYYSLDVAAALDDGTLDILDISEEFLDNVVHTAKERGIENITATQGDARALPYANHSFDADLPPGAKATTVLKSAGAIAFACRYHPGMRGVLHVQ